MRGRAGGWGWGGPGRALTAAVPSAPPCPHRLPFSSSQGAPVAIAVAVVAASALLLLLLRGTARRPSGPVTLQDPLAKYPLRLLDKEVTAALRAVGRRGSEGSRSAGLRSSWPRAAPGIESPEQGTEPPKDGCDPCSHPVMLPGQGRMCKRVYAALRAVVSRCFACLTRGCVSPSIPVWVHHEKQARQPALLHALSCLIFGHRHGMCSLALGTGFPDFICVKAL